MDAIESRDIVVTSNRGPDQWLATFADPVRAQADVERFTSSADDLVIDGGSYRARQKPTLPRSRAPSPRPGPGVGGVEE